MIKHRNDKLSHLRQSCVSSMCPAPSSVSSLLLLLPRCCSLAVLPSVISRPGPLLRVSTMLLLCVWSLYCTMYYLLCTVYCVMSGLAECLLATDGAMVAGAGSTAPRRQGAGPAQARANSRAAQFVPLICGGCQNWNIQDGSIVRRRTL